MIDTLCIGTLSKLNANVSLLPLNVQHHLIFYHADPVYKLNPDTREHELIRDGVTTKIVGAYARDNKILVINNLYQIGSTDVVLNALLKNRLIGKDWTLRWTEASFSLSSWDHKIFERACKCCDPGKYEGAEKQVDAWMDGKTVEEQDDLTYHDAARFEEIDIYVSNKEEGK
tara:strand:+ start:223 stop:738 length:516 start_codon:yes stop_codon:yes gene_type:complete